MKTYKYQGGYKFQSYLDWKVRTDRCFKVFHVNEYPDNFYRYRNFTGDKRQQLIAADEILYNMTDEEFLRQVSEL